LRLEIFMAISSIVRKHARNIRGHAVPILLVSIRALASTENRLASASAVFQCRILGS